MGYLNARKSDAAMFGEFADSLRRSKFDEARAPYEELMRRLNAGTISDDFFKDQFKHILKMTDNQGYNLADKGFSEIIDYHNKVMGIKTEPPKVEEKQTWNETKKDIDATLEKAQQIIPPIDDVPISQSEPSNPYEYKVAFDEIKQEDIEHFRNYVNNPPKNENKTYESNKTNTGYNPINLEEELKQQKMYEEEVRRHLDSEIQQETQKAESILNKPAEEITQEVIEKAGQDAAKVAGRYKTFGTKVLPGLLGATATLVGLASVISIGLDNNSKDRTIRENMKADRKIKEQQKKDEKDYGDLGYGFETYQEVMANAQKGKKFKGDPVIDMLKYDNTVQDMYSNRTGHTNMGNSRFR